MQSAVVKTIYIFVRGGSTAQNITNYILHKNIVIFVGTAVLALVRNAIYSRKPPGYAS